MRSTDKARLTIVQMNDTHAYFDLHHSAAFVTMQGVPQKYGQNRLNQSKRIIDAMRKYLAKNRPVRAELRGTYIAV